MEAAWVICLGVGFPMTFGAALGLALIEDEKCRADGELKSDRPNGDDSEIWEITVFLYSYALIGVMLFCRGFWSGVTGKNKTAAPVVILFLVGILLTGAGVWLQFFRH